MIRAVLFDLFGTLVESGSMPDRDSLSHKVASELSIDGQAFAELVRSTFDSRMRGELGGLTDTYVELARRLRGSPQPGHLDRAIQLRLNFTHQLLEDTSAAPLLHQLRSAGYLLGVISDCSIETPTVWETTWLGRAIDTFSFSCQVGVRKPDPSVYLAATQALGVPPDECLYVGDGGSHELSGARALGMHPVLVADPREEGRERPDEEIDWAGDKISSLSEIPTRLGL
jgi:putative hydrolase of the HAD superfamily